MSIRTIRALIVILLSICLHGCPAPKVVRDYGVNADVMTIASTQGGVFYLLKLSLEDEVPPNSSAFIRYEKLDQPGEYSELSLGSLGESKVMNFRSILSPAVDADHIYTLQVRLQDPETGEVVAAYNALLKAEITAKISDLLQIKLL